MRGTIIVLAAVLVTHLAAGQQIDTLVPCHNSSDCASFSKPRSDEAFCSNGHCVCPGENGKPRNCSSAALMAGPKSVVVPLVSRTCAHDQECMIKNGFCNTTRKQCDCLKGYVSSANKQQCLKVAEWIGDFCIEGQQCSALLPNTTCQNEKCVCGTGFHNISNMCWKTAGFGEPCTKVQECSHIRGAICNDKSVCSCKPREGISRDGRKCLSAAEKVYDACTEDSQCSTTLADTLCIDRKCACREKFHYEVALSKCKMNKALDESCADRYECYQPDDDNSTRSLICLANVCECADGFDRAGDKCVNDDSGRLDGSLLGELLYNGTIVANDLEKSPVRSNRTESVAGSPASGPGLAILAAAVLASVLSA